MSAGNVSEPQPPQLSAIYKTTAHNSADGMRAARQTFVFVSQFGQGHTAFCPSKIYGLFLLSGGPVDRKFKQVFSVVSCCENAYQGVLFQDHPLFLDQHCAPQVYLAGVASLFAKVEIPQNPNNPK